MEGEIDFAKE